MKVCKKTDKADKGDKLLTLVIIQVENPSSEIPVPEHVADFGFFQFTENVHPSDIFNTILMPQHTTHGNHNE